MTLRSPATIRLAIANVRQRSETGCGSRANDRERSAGVEVLELVAVEVAVEDSVNPGHRPRSEQESASSRSRRRGLLSRRRV